MISEFLGHWSSQRALLATSAEIGSILNPQSRLLFAPLERAKFIGCVLLRHATKSRPCMGLPAMDFEQRVGLFPALLK